MLSDGGSFKNIIGGFYMAIEVTNYQCPACTGPLQFAGGSGKLECEYCGNDYEVSTIEMLFADKERAAAEAKPVEWATDDAGSPWGEAETAGIRTYSCPSCAAEIICDEHTAATSCVYCGNPTVVPGQLGGALKPDYVIPFKLDQKAAEVALKKFYSGKLFLPNAFTKGNKISEIKSIYAPFWLFNGKAVADVIFTAQRVSSHNTSKEKVTTTEHFRIARSGTIEFERIPVDGSTKMPDAHMDAIEPYNYDDMVPFSTAYLPGHFADKYDQDADACAPRASDRIMTSATDALRSTIQGYSSVQVDAADIDLAYGEVKYALLPVWLLNTSWNGKLFTFAMNGQTGKLVGDLPVDKGKVFKWFVGIAAPLAAVAALIMHVL